MDLNDLVEAELNKGSAVSWLKQKVKDMASDKDGKDKKKYKKKRTVAMGVRG